jgi:hypothetical protein
MLKKSQINEYSDFLCLCFAILSSIAIATSVDAPSAR